MDIPGLQADQADRHWRPGRAVSPLTGRTLLLVGVGRTGQQAARLADALGMRVEGVQRTPRPMRHLAAVHAPDDIAGAMVGADYILVCLPLTDASRGLIGTAALSAVRPGAVLVDLSRGGIVDPAALLRALDAGRLKGAALDVFPTEPLPPENLLWGRPDVLISPHCSGVYDGWEARAVEMFADNLNRWRTDQPLENIVDPVAGY
jgi:phosphoglycerate dehydrogenase-like enzyme